MAASPSTSGPGSKLHGASSTQRTSAHARASGQHAAADAGHGAQHAVFDGERASHDAAGGAERAEHDRLVEPLRARGGQRRGHHHQAGTEREERPPVVRRRRCRAARRRRARARRATGWRSRWGTCATMAFCSALSAAAGTRAVATHVAGAPSSAPGERITKKLVLRLCQSTRRMLVTTASTSTPWMSKVSRAPSPAPRWRAAVSSSDASGSARVARRSTIGPATIALCSGGVSLQVNTYSRVKYQRPPSSRCPLARGARRRPA